MSKTKDVVDCLRRAHRALVKLELGRADPLHAVLLDVEATLARPAIVEVVERRASRERDRRVVSGERVPDAVAPALSLLMLGEIDPEPSAESLAEMPEISADAVPLGRGLLRARRAAALWFAARQLRETGEAGTESAALLLDQLAAQYEDGE